MSTSKKPGQFDPYLARLHNIAGDRPLVFSEIGFDSTTHGHAGQAALLVNRVESIFEQGSAGSVHLQLH